MTRRSWMLAVAMLALTAGGVWAGLALANARTTNAGCCCDDPTCPPGCTPECAAECLPAAKTITKAMAKESCCPEDEVCLECAAECLPAAKTSSKMTAKTYICPPCPFCPGW